MDYVTTSIIELLSAFFTIIIFSSTHLFVYRALGISTLGEEILYTCHALYGKDQLYHKAEGLELLKLDTVTTKTFGPHILQLAKAKPFVCLFFCSVFFRI